MRIKILIIDTIICLIAIFHNVFGVNAHTIVMITGNPYHKWREYTNNIGTSLRTGRLALNICFE